MKFVVDRIEGNFAICECSDGRMKDILLSHIETEPKDGDVLIFDGNLYKIDCKATEENKNKIHGLYTKLKKQIMNKGENHD